MAILGCLFAFESALTLETLAQKYVAALAGTPFGLHIDVIVVLDRGLVTLVANAPDRTTWSTSMAVDGSGGGQSEGFHVAVAPQEFGDRALDAFLRLLIAHLAMFRHTVDHPGFDWASLGAPPELVVHYLFSMTAEQDNLAHSSPAEHRFRATGEVVSSTRGGDLGLEEQHDPREVALVDLEGARAHEAQRGSPADAEPLAPDGAATEADGAPRRGKDAVGGQDGAFISRFGAS